MTPPLKEEKPSLVPAGQGFSVLNTLQYKGRFLYSKYNPTRSILTLLEKTVILPGSLIIICSPALWYGLEELIKILPEDCVIAAVEADDNLFTFSKSVLNFNLFYSEKNILDFYRLLQDSLSQGRFRRAIRLDFSAGVQFNQAFYQDTCYNAEKIIASFWKNRLTITKLGRLFAKNIFKNLTCLQQGYMLTSFFNSIEKPIVIFGAGESLDKSFKNCSDLTAKLQSGNFFVLAVDASLDALNKRGIPVDAVVAMEAQYAIQEAYIGCQKSCKYIFADLCSRPQVVKSVKAKTIWFASEYANCRYLEKIKKLGLAPDFIPPMGSVGLAAVYIALKIRKNESVPVFFTGLDFSYSAGKTHARLAPANKRSYYTTNRFKSIFNFDAAYAPGVQQLTGKDGKKVFTTMSMLSYAQNFIELFSKAHNLFDSGDSGLPLGLSRFSFKETDKLSYITDVKSPLPLNEAEAIKKINNVKNYLSSEKEILKQIKDLLSRGDMSEYRNKGKSLEKQVEEILTDRDYLYLHFPDGYKLSMTPAFLKRVRAELDSFEKILSTPLFP